MEQLLETIKSCTICAEHLEFGVNPVLSASAHSRIAIIGQAPGSVVHRTGIPWDDKSGERLRKWLGVDSSTFYDPALFALVPMGFCYPGKGKSGDLPPRPECAPAWHTQLFQKMRNIELKVLIGSYAVNYYLEEKQKNLTESVRRFERYMPDVIVLPHPSPRNNIWLKKNPWFEAEVLPRLRERVSILVN